MTRIDSPLWRRALREAAGTRRRLRATATPVTPAAEPYLVVAVMGQSNAHGAGRAIDLAGQDAPDPRVHQWPASTKWRGRIVQAVEPLLHETPGNGMGPATTFAKGLADLTGRPVLLVPAARGDTSFHPKDGVTWDPDDHRTRRNLFREAMTQIDGALAAAPGSTLSAVIWHQGESDAPLMAPADYQDRLDTLFRRLRERHGEVPIVVGGMCPEWISSDPPTYVGIDAVHADSPRRHARLAFVEGPADLNEGAIQELGHYSAEGQRELGRRYLAAFAALSD